jgi:hypothetical protein
MDTNTTHYLSKLDSNRVAYVTGAGKKWFVVVDGKKGKQYDKFVMNRLRFVIFDSLIDFIALLAKAAISFW